MKRLTWEQKSGRHQSGKKGWRNKVALFEYCWDEGKWLLLTRLPGVPDRLGSFNTEEDAQKKAEQVFDMWLNLMGLTANT